MLGRYELVASIATGSIGELWRARIASGPEEGRVVSIRRIPRTEKLDAKAVERITNAGFAAMELRHPKVAAVLDVFVAETEIGIVSEHIAGSVVQALVRPQGSKRVTVPIPAALRIAVDVLEAVDAVRDLWAELVPEPETDDERRLAAGVHGGLVPDGLWIASFGETMLLEVGLTGVALSLPAILEHPEVIAYRAPEQLEPRGPIAERSDVFTVGILIWELIAGRPLFGSAPMPRPGPPAPKGKGTEALQVSSVRRKVLSAPAQRLDTMPFLKGKVSKALADVVERCLERDPNARFQSAREAIAAIVALGPGTVGSTDSVAKIVASMAVDAPREEPSRPALGSDRPTVPPDEEMSLDTSPPQTRKAAKVASPVGIPPDDVTRRRFGQGSPAVETPAATPAQPAAGAVRTESPTLSDIGAETISPRTEVATLETLAPAAPLVESIPAPRSTQETLPAGSFHEDGPVPASAGGAAAAPVSADFLNVPPGAGTEGLPPSGLAPASGEFESVGPVSDDGTMVKPAGIHQAPLAPFVDQIAPSYPERIELASTAGVSADRYGRSSDELPAPIEASALGGEGADERRAKSKKIVVIVMAVAGLLALAGILRVLLSSHEEPASPSGATAASGAALAEPARAPGATAPAPAPEAPAGPAGEQGARGAAPPTSSPSPAAPAAGTPESVEGSKKPVIKKKPYRPTGI